MASHVGAMLGLGAAPYRPGAPLNLANFACGACAEVHCAYAPAKGATFAGLHF